MTKRELRSDIILILQKSKVSKDSRISERHIEFLIDKYYAVGVRQGYKSNLEIDPAWLLDTGKVLFTAVNSAEDISVPETSVILGKYTLPSMVVSLPDDGGLYRVSSSSKMTNYHKTTASWLFQILGTPGSELARFNYCFRIGRKIYTYPNVGEGNILFIADQPNNVPVLLTEDQDSLIIGDSYTVIDEAITSGGVKHAAGSIFTATAATFTGDGRVRFTVQKRNRTIDDDYPCSLNLAEVISMKIFTQDFKIEMSVISDIKNDSTDELNVLQKNN